MRPITWISTALLGMAMATQSVAANPPALRDHHDAELQAELEATMSNIGLLDNSRRGELGLAVIDITDPDSPRVASINGDRMYYAASLPKIAILLGAFVEIEKGDMKLDKPTRESLTRMIRVSSNKDATRMLRAVGKENLAEILQSERFNLYDPKHNGGLWVGKEYSKHRAWKRDPLHNISHGATPIQAARFYYMMETGQLVSKKLTHEMKEMLGNPGIKHKFVKGLAGKKDIKIYRKSGSWSRWHADSALIEHGKHRYIVVALAENRNGGEWMSRMIGPIDDMITRGHRRVATFKTR